MPDEFLLFLVLSLIYLTECFLWLGEHSIAFVAFCGRRWEHKKPNEMFRASTGGIIILNPFPPLGKALCSHLPPLSISPKGICVGNSQVFAHGEVHRHESTAILFQEMSSIKAIDRDVFVNNSRFLKCKTSQQAAKLSALLNSLLESTEESRNENIQQFWTEQFDCMSAKVRFNEAFHQITQLKILCNSLFFYLFLFAPALVLYTMSTRILIAIGLGMLIIAIRISIEYYVSHKRIFPAAKEERIINLIKMIFCPPASVRACDLVTENLLADWNPLVIGHLLLSPDGFLALATRTLRNFQYPVADDSADEQVRAIRKWHDHALSSIVFKYLVREANLKGDLLSPPIPEDDNVRSYCPRCLSQFTREQGACPSCGGIDLLPFSAVTSNHELMESGNERIL
jgi:hypothetical protein